ncbi:hypothetical protein CBS11852_9222 [Aspergillus niger]|nr:hypothetical protein CBS11852_9222 [Aspergillus niger]
MELQLQKSYDPPQKKPKEHNKAKLNTPASSTSQLSHLIPHCTAANLSLAVTARGTPDHTPLSSTPHSHNPRILYYCQQQESFSRSIPNLPTALSRHTTH